jgi:hypothetical protein
MANKLNEIFGNSYADLMLDEVSTDIDSKFLPTLKKAVDAAHKAALETLEKIRAEDPVDEFDFYDDIKGNASVHYSNKNNEEFNQSFNALAKKIDTYNTSISISGKQVVRGHFTKDIASIYVVFEELEKEGEPDVLNKYAQIQVYSIQAFFKVLKDAGYLADGKIVKMFRGA